MRCYKCGYYDVFRIKRNIFQQLIIRQIYKEALEKIKKLENFQNVLFFYKQKNSNSSILSY